MTSRSCWSWSKFKIIMGLSLDQSINREFIFFQNVNAADNLFLVILVSRGRCWTWFSSRDYLSSVDECAALLISLPHSQFLAPTHFLSFYLSVSHHHPRPSYRVLLYIFADVFIFQEMVVLGIYGVLYLIAVIVIATQICGQSAVGAAAVRLIVHFFLTVLIWSFSPCDYY